jgi:hypothetical protein
MTEDRFAHRPGGARMRIVCPVAVVCALVLLAACGSGDATSSSTSTTSTTSAGRPTTSAPSTTVSRSTTSVSTTPCAVVLREGCAGQGVTDLQQLLTDRAFGTFPVDGVFGARTRDGLHAFELTCGACTRDDTIEVNGGEWEELRSRPVVTTPTSGRESSR